MESQNSRRLRCYDGGYWIEAGNNNALIPEAPLLEGLDMVLATRNEDGSTFLVRVLAGRDYECRDKIFGGLIDSIPELVIHPGGASVFGELVAACTDNQLKLIVDKIASHPEFFIQAAFERHSYHSVLDIIARLKDSPVELASIVTSILSTNFCKLMTTTRPNSSNSIKHCLRFLGNQPNKVLFEAAIIHCSELSTHQQGHKSLIDFITHCKSDVHKDRILHVIADKSDYLSVDRFGKYVVMHALKLGNLSINYKICWLLRGLYTQLSSDTKGYYLVIMCIISSCIGMRLVVEELLENGNTLSQLSQDHFGKYVIQQALETTRQCASGKLYEDLVAALRPHFSHIEQSSHTADPEAERYGMEHMRWPWNSVGRPSEDEPAAVAPRGFIYFSE